MMSTAPSVGVYTHSERVAASLAERIRAGDLKRGERLASEHSLAQQYGASRGTIRRALTLLQNSALIETKRGSGSYVAFRGADLSGSQGWTAATQRTDMPTTTDVLSTTLGPPPEHLVELCVEPECYTVMRLRHHREQPLSLEISTFPATEQVSTVMEFGLLGGSVSKTLRATGLRVIRASQAISARLVPAAYAELLQQSPGTRMILTERTGLDKDGHLVEYVESWLDPDHFTLHTTFEE